MKVSLPDSMKACGEAKVHGGQYGNVSDCERDLTRYTQQDCEQIEIL